MTSEYQYKVISIFNMNMLHSVDLKCLSTSSDPSDLPEAQQGLQVPQILELVPPLGRPAGALLRSDQHCRGDQGRRRRQLVEDRLRFQPGRPPDHHHHPRSPAVDEMEKQQQFYGGVLSMLKLGSYAVVTGRGLYFLDNFACYAVGCCCSVLCSCVLQGLLQQQNLQDL